MAEYISTENALQRANVIRSAKFPRKVQVVPYALSRRTISAFLAENTGDLSSLDNDIRRLETRLRREPDGWMQGEIRRNIAAIKAFKKTFTKTRAKRFTFIAGPTDLAMRIAGVLVNARLDMTLTETGKDGTTYSGGCATLIANTEQSRKKIDERRKTVAALIHWGLERSNSNIEVLPRLCLSFDVFGSVVTPAPKAFERLRSHVISSCEEAAARWDDIDPPAGYDGPDWTGLI